MLRKSKLTYKAIKMTWNKFNYVNYLIIVALVKLFISFECLLKIIKDIFLPLPLNLYEEWVWVASN